MHRPPASRSWPGFEFRDLPESDVAQTFGEDFAAWIDKAAPGAWDGPVTSAYGTHLVRVTGRVEAREPPFEQVREAARREWLHARKVAANDALYEKLRSRYVIKVEAVPGRHGRAKAGRGGAVIRLLVALWLAADAHRRAGAGA